MSRPKIEREVQRKMFVSGPGLIMNMFFGVQSTLRGLVNFVHQKKFFKNRPLLDQDPPPQGLILQLPKLDHLVFHVRFDKQWCLFLLSMTAQCWIYIDILSVFYMMRAHISIAMVRFRPRIKFDSDWNFADKPALLLWCVHAHTLICQYF